MIYDNVKTLISIYKYLPSSYKSWGERKVIITTRNNIISNDNHIERDDIVNVGEINNKDKCALFSTINPNLSIKNATSQANLEKFLQELPSFPLDISIAASYIRETGISFDKYLNEIRSSERSFNRLQVSILKDLGQYTKTRYNIVSLAVKQGLQANPEFCDLYLLLGLLDSQKIPTELLVRYKDQYIASEFIRHLKKNSFITDLYPQDEYNQRNSFLSTFSIHRSTQDNILAYMLGFLSAPQQQTIVSNLLDCI